MAIGTPVLLGNSGSAGSGSTISFTSGSAVPSGALVIVAVSWYGTQTVTMSGGSLSWGSTDKTQVGVADTNYHCGVWSAQAPSGVSSSTTFTATFSTSTSNPMISGHYCEGLDTTSPVDATGGQNTTGNNSNWSAGALTNATADALFFAAAAIDALRTCTVTSPIFELADFQNSGAGTTQTTCYRIVSSVGSVTMSGTISSNLNLEKVAPVVAYKGASGAAATSLAPVQPYRSLYSR